MGHFLPVSLLSGKQHGISIYSDFFGRHTQSNRFRLENMGTVLGRGIFPCSLTYSLAFYLQMSRNFANIVYELYIRYG